MPKLNYEQIASAIVDMVKKNLVSRDAKIAALEAKLAALEAKQAELETKALSSHKVYAQHTIVTDDGGHSWLAERATIAPPGGNGDWRLIDDRRVQ